MDALNTARITIVIPVYKVEKYIHRCIDSVLNQTFREFEIVLVDDGSPDSCGDICDSYVKIFANQGILCKVIHQQNGGLSDARNSGIEWSLKNSKSEWITFIDSDDWIIPEYLEVLYNAVNDCKVDIAVGSYDEVRDESEVKSYDPNTSAELVDIEEFWVNHRTNATVAWGKLYPKKYFEEVRYPKGKKHEDEYVTYQLLFQYDSIAYVDIPVYHYFYNGEGISKGNYLNRLPDLLESFANHMTFFKNKKWKEVYRLEVEMYAAALSDGIWIQNSIKDGNKEISDSLRKQLLSFLDQYKQYIPLEKRKDIYIAAYPKLKILIRIYGFIKGKVKR